MKRWQWFEDLLVKEFPKGMGSFTSQRLSNKWGVSTEEITKCIQAYQTEQEKEDSQAQFCVTRKAGTRTLGTIWQVGNQKENAINLPRQSMDDFRFRAQKTIIPVLKKMGLDNKKIERLVEILITRVETDIELMVLISPDD